MGQNQAKEKAGEDEETTTPILLSNLNSEKEMEKQRNDLCQLAYLGYFDEIKRILDQDDFKGDLLSRRVDIVGMTPVHNAALGGGRAKVEMVKMLLKHDKDDTRSDKLEPLVNIKDMKGRTPLALAALARSPLLIGLLLDEFDADPNIKTIEGMTPLHLCAQQGYSEEAVTCAEILLKSSKINRYEPCGPEKFQQSPVHLAAASMADKMLKCLIHKGFDHGKPDARGMTALHYAAASGDTEEAVSCVKTLLRVMDIKEINAKASGDGGKTALMLAAWKCHVNVLKVLLEDVNTDIWVKDNEQKTALHHTCEAWFRTQSLACVKLLVESEKVKDWRDKAMFLYGENDGDLTDKPETAMDIALKHKSLRIAEYLIQAHPSPEAWLTDEMLDKIYKTLPESMLPLMNTIGLTYNAARFHERNESVDAEFGVLVGYKDPVDDEPRQETKYLHHVRQAPHEIQQQFLLHPLVQLFIDLKWKRIRPITWMAIFYQFLWLFFYTILIFEVYVPNCTASYNNESIDNQPPNKTKNLKLWLSFRFYSKEDSNIADCEFNTEVAIFLAVILYFMTSLLVVKELFQMRKKGVTSYFRKSSNWLQWILFVLFVFNSVPAFYGNPEPWQIYLAACGIFIGWGLSLREIAKFPNCGIYSAILRKVFWHCLKMLAFYFPLLLAFAMSLHLLLPGKGQYMYFLFAITKVVIMMTGELDFDDAFYEDDGPRLAFNFILGQLVFLLLVFITCIVLLNLLTGLAVNDVGALIEEAEINRLSNELEQIYLWESLLLLIREKFGPESCCGLFYRVNVTASPEFHYFVSKISGIETRRYSGDLKKRIRSVMVADESSD